MLIFDYAKIGNKLHTYRKRLGMTQADVAERAGLSDRTYADIERGTVNMRIKTLLRICKALGITPNDVLTEEPSSHYARKEEVLSQLEHCTEDEKRTVWRLLSLYLESKK